MAKKIEIKPARKGLLHKNLGVPAGDKIPPGKLNEALNSASGAVRKRANFAKNASRWNN